MIWGDGLGVNPGALHAKAARLLESEAGLRRTAAAIEATDVGSWRGDAARAERSERRRIIDDLDRQADALPRAASALRDAGDQFAGIQATQGRAIASAGSWQYRYTDAGVVLSTAQGINLDPRRPFVRAQLQGIAVNVTIRLNATDLALGGRLGVLALQFGVSSLVDAVGNGLLDAGEWLGDKILDGLDWSRDRIRDAYEWGQDRVRDVVDWFHRGTEAAGPAWTRFLDTLGTRPQWFDDLVTRGELPQVAEVLGSTLFTGAQLVGAGWDFVTGERHHLFDDGRPWVGAVEPYRQSNYTGVQDVMATAMDVYESRGTDPDGRPAVQVTAVEGPDGTVRYIVAIPGTTEDLTSLDGWSGSNAGTDWAANLKGVGFGTSSATEAAMQAVDLAIQKDMAARRLTGTPQLLLTGHSQGGIIAANMAADPSFSSRYNVQGIVSAGSPQQTIPIPSDVAVYNFQNALDPVPRVDLGGLNVDGTTNRQGNVTNIVIPHSGNPLPGHTHAQSYYQQGINELAGGGGSWQNQLQMEQLNSELGQFLNGETTAYRVEFGRETDR